MSHSRFRAGPGPWHAVWVAAIALGGCMSSSVTATKTPPGEAPKVHDGSGAEPGRAAAELAGAEHLDRRQLVAAVLERNPSIDAARDAYRAARARQAQRESLPDPMVSYSFAPLSIFSNDVRYGQIIELSQTFPWPGKLAERGEIAVAEAAAKQADYETTRLELALMASTSFDDWYAVERALEVNESFEALFAELKESAEAQYATGRGSLQDPLQAEVEISHLQHQRVVLESERATLIARLNGLLHQSLDTKLPPPPSELDDRLPPPPAKQALAQIAIARRPELGADRARIRGSEAEVEYADDAYYPDFAVMGSYSSMWAEVEHQFMLGVSANIPLQRTSRRGAVEQASAELSASRHALARRIDDILVEVEQARLRFVEARHVVMLYNERLLPAGRDQARVALPAFQTGQTSFIEVVSAQKNLLLTELGRHMAVAEMYRRRARLDRVVGRLPGTDRERSRRSP